MCSLFILLFCSLHHSDVSKIPLGNNSCKTVSCALSAQICPFASVNVGDIHLAGVNFGSNHIVYHISKSLTLPLSLIFICLFRSTKS